MSLIDAIDLTAVSVVLYAILRWLAASMSRRVLVALAIVVALYVVSRAAGLFLTERLLRVSGGVLAVALLVAFQEDVRRGFERMAVWTRAGRDTLGEARATLECLSEVVSRRSGWVRSSSSPAARASKATFAAASSLGDRSACRSCVASSVPSLPDTMAP